MDTFLTILSYYPVVESVPFFFLYYGAQILRMIKTKSSNDLSLIALSVTTISYTIYLLYGIFIVKEWQYIFAMILAVVGDYGILITAIILRIKNKSKVKDIVKESVDE